MTTRKGKSEVRPEATLPAIFDMLESTGAAIAKLIPRDKDGVATHLVLVVKGKDETREMLEVIEALEARWEAEHG